jgi:hypothetical protein
VSLASCALAMIAWAMIDVDPYLDGPWWVFIRAGLLAGSFFMFIDFVIHLAQETADYLRRRWGIPVAGGIVLLFILFVGALWVAL